MNLIDILNTRYATKKFDPEYALSAEQLTQIKALLRLSPSSVNIQPWHFLLADTATGKQRIAKGAEGMFAANRDKILNAALVVVLCVRTHVDDAYMQQLLAQENSDGRFADDAERRAIQHGVRSGYTDLHRYVHKDVPHWLEKQVYLNMGGLLLGVAALGLDAVPIEGIDQQVLDAEFDLHAQGYSAVTAVAIGRRAADDANAALPKSRLPEKTILTILD